jgi:hypothetical protein
MPGRDPGILYAGLCLCELDRLDFQHGQALTHMHGCQRTSADDNWIHDWALGEHMKSSYSAKRKTVLGAGFEPASKNEEWPREEGF